MIAGITHLKAEILMTAHCLFCFIQQYIKNAYFLCYQAFMYSYDVKNKTTMHFVVWIQIHMKNI